MPFLEVKRDPSPRERKALGLALGALGGFFALMIGLKPESLLVITWVTGLAWCASLLFNKNEPLSRQWKGLLIPLTLSLVYVAVQLTEEPVMIAVATAGVLAVLGIVVWIHERVGNKFYETWSLLFLPLAWSTSTFLLVLVYYGVITPIGFLLRFIGRDPLQREFDQEKKSYWVERDESEDSKRYFRQF